MAAGAARDDSAVAAPRPPASRWSRRRGFVLAAVGVAAASVMGITITALTVADSEPSEDDAADAGKGTSTGPVFDAPTNTVLLFSDGIDGVPGLDLDAGVVGAGT